MRDLVNLAILAVILLGMVMIMNLNDKLDKAPNSCRLSSEQQKESMIKEYNKELF